MTVTAQREVVEPPEEVVQQATRALPGPIMGCSTRTGNPYTIVTKRCAGCGNDFECKVFWNPKLKRPSWVPYCKPCDKKYNKGELQTKKYKPRGSKTTPVKESGLLDPISRQEPAHDDEPVPRQRGKRPEIISVILPAVESKTALALPPTPEPPIIPPSLMDAEQDLTLTALAHRPIDPLDEIMRPIQKPPEKKMPPKPPDLATAKGLAGVKKEAPAHMHEMEERLTLVASQNSRLHKQVEELNGTVSAQAKYMADQFSAKLGTLRSEFNKKLEQMDAAWRERYETKTKELDATKKEMDTMMENIAEIQTGGKKGSKWAQWGTTKGTSVADFKDMLNGLGCRDVVEDKIIIALLTPGGRKINTGRIMDRVRTVDRVLYKQARSLLAREGILLP